MRYLLDSVALLLWWSDSVRLGAAARATLTDGAARLYVSAINIWEIVNKNRIGKLAALRDFPGDFDRLVLRDGFEVLDLTPAHAMKAGYLPGAHRDPFDACSPGRRWSRTWLY